VKSPVVLLRAATALSMLFATVAPRQLGGMDFLPGWMPFDLVSQPLHMADGVPTEEAECSMRE